MERLTTILIKNMLVVALNWELKKGNNRNSTLRQKIRLFSSYITLFSTRQNSQFLSCKCYVVFDFDMKSTTIRHDAMAAQTNQRPKVCSFQYTPRRPCLFVWMMASDQGGAEDSYSAWHFFCVRIIQQKVTSHPVRQRATSLPGAKTKIYGNRFFYSASKMMIFCNRLHILSLFFVHPVKELSLFTSMDYSTV